MVRPLSSKGPSDYGYDAEDDVEISYSKLQSCMVLGSLLVFTSGSLLCIVFVNLFHLTYFELLYSLIVVDDPRDPWPVAGHWFVWQVIMLATVTSIIGGFGYSAIRMQRRAILCCFSVGCLVLCGGYMLLFGHMRNAKDTLDTVVSAQVDEFCNATTEWAYVAHLHCHHGSLPAAVEAEAEALINQSAECQKDLRLLRYLERAHSIHACAVLEHLCHHMNFELVGAGRCLIDHGGETGVVPPVIRSKKVENASDVVILNCCELGCASVVGCAGFWHREGQCVLVSPHRPFFHHMLKSYPETCQNMTWENYSVGADDVHVFVPDQPTISEETDGASGTSCWRKGSPKMMATFDKTAAVTIVLCVLASVILVLVSCCSCQYHYALAQMKFPETRKNPCWTIRKMCWVFFETPLRRRRGQSARKRDELLGLDYSSDEMDSE